MGKKKSSLTKIDGKNKLHVTFEKRKRGLLKKVIELSHLCD